MNFEFKKVSGIYFHIPFCRRVCGYCDFARTADMRRRDEVVAAMHDELHRRRGFLHNINIGTVYFGGGTPTVLPPAELQRMVDTAAGIYDLTAVGECTAEANPDDLTAQYISELRRTSVNRLSIGIQSFDDGCLRMMNRRHTAAEAVGAVKRAQDAGFENISVDLIFGVDGYGGEVLERNIGIVVELGVQHVSAYHLTVEPGTAFARRVADGGMRTVGEDVSEAEYMALHEGLTAAGYEHYEVSNYALPGRRSRHNSAYWQGAEYLGIGPGAHSFDGERRCWNAATVGEYLSGSGGGEEALTERDRRNEMIMTSLRTAEGLDMQSYAGRFGREAAMKTFEDAKSFLLTGVLVFDNGRLRIPTEKFLISDNVIESLFEA